ncbi:MAG TPA: hypothetical protein VKS99_15960, partial [Blastocatellia bacterium]|nr:hypothetical protein [Blastocatellia bacterium]
GVANFGRDFASPAFRDTPRAQFIDNFSLPHGRHDIKFGADASRYRVSSATFVFLGGAVDFPQLPIPLSLFLEQAMSGTSAQVITALNASGRSDLIPVITSPMQPPSSVQFFNFGVPRGIQQGVGNPNVTTTGAVIGAYAQDGFKARKNLYLSYGLRYDYEQQPSGTPSDYDNFGPRVGFAYDPFNDGKTVIRGGGGLYYQTVSTGVGYISNVFANGQISNILVTVTPQLTPISPTSPCGLQLARGVPPSVCLYQSLVAQGLLTFPSNRTIQEADILRLAGVDRNTGTNRITGRVAKDLVNPYSIQSSLGVDRELGRDWNLSVNYLLNRGIKLIRSRQINAMRNPAVLDSIGRVSLSGRVDPTKLSDSLFESAGSSTYHGATVSLNKRFSKHYQVIGSYAYSKTISDTSDLNLDFGPQDPTNPRDDRSLSSFDLRHRLTLAAILESPYRNGSGSSWYQRALADFYVSPIFTARSGFPFNIRTGFDVNLDAVSNDRPAGVGRNTFLGPDFFSTDLRVGRQVRLNGDSPLGLEVIVDAFNLFNRTNFKDVNNITNTPILNSVMFPDVRVQGNRAVPANQFSGFTSAYDPRIIQLGLKLNF